MGLDLIIDIEMSESRPKIRTSMQMSRASVDALKAAQLQENLRAWLSPEPTNLPKKILKIPHFHLLDTQSAAAFRPEVKTVSFDKAKTPLSLTQSPVSDPSHRPIRIYSSSQRRRSAVTPAFTHIFKEDWQPPTSPNLLGTSPKPVETGATHESVSSDELESSIQIRGIVSPNRRKRLANRPVGSLAPSRLAATWSFEYLMATAGVLTCTKDLVRRHTWQKIPARLLKF